RFRTKFDSDWNACRPNRDGRFSQHSFAPMAAPVDHATDRDCSGGDHRSVLWNERDRETAFAQPGHSQHAAFVRGHSARPVHERPAQDGPVRFTALVAGARMGHGDDHRRAEREIFGRLVWSHELDRNNFLAMYQKILVALENSRADEALLPHIAELAKLHG